MSLERRESGRRKTARAPRYLEPGSSTAVDVNVRYRLEKLVEHGLLAGRWLDCGCADGGYTRAMAMAGATVTGIDLDDTRIAQARAASSGSRAWVSYVCASSEALPFPAESFDGVFLNEVLEHVADELQTLREIRRVLRPGGHLALMSPNRWFPFEGHGLRVNERFSIDFPVPLVPWLPSRIVARFVRARNYWPGELTDLVESAGFRVLESRSVFPVFEVFPWLPSRVIRLYRRFLPLLERAPVLRRFGVSTFVLAKKPERHATPNGRAETDA